MRWLLLFAIACKGPSSGEKKPDAPLSLTAVTFNTGTTVSMGSDGPYDGYGETEAAISDAWYGDGLAWLPVVADAEAFFAETRPDVVAFQEIFWSGECPEIPPEDQVGWICEQWQPGDPTVAEIILGPDYQVACNLEKPDKCLAVRLDFGHFEGCEGSLCLDHLGGAEIDQCGSGSRIGRGKVILEEGGDLTVVEVHGTSGLTPDDRDCRAKQFAAVFEDMDGEPAANGSRNLVMGDFNTDPGRNAEFDMSAEALNTLSEQSGFEFLTEVGPEAEATYAGIFNIDHVLSDALVGDCTPDFDVTEVTYFDHVPIVCDLSTPAR